MKKLILLLVLITSCSKSKLDLSESPLEPSSKLDNNSSELLVQKTSNRSAPDNSIYKKAIFDLLLGKKQYIFHKLPIPPSLVLNSKEKKILKGVIDFFKQWDIESFSSLDELNAARFLSSIFIAHNKEDTYFGKEINALRRFALPFLLHKRLNLTHKSPIGFESIKKLTYKFYKMGFNLNFASNKDLSHYLDSFNEVIFKGRRSGRVGKRSSISNFKQIFQYLSKSETATLKKMISTITKATKIKESSFRFLDYEIKLFPVKNRNPNFRLTLFVKEKQNELLIKKVSSYMKNPNSSFDITLPKTSFKETHIIAASGSCPLCFKKDSIPGSFKAPRSLRIMDWNRYGQKLLDKIFDKQTARVLDSCVPSLIDFHSRLTHYLAPGKGFPGENAKGHHFSPNYTDGQILRALWIEVFIQHLTLSQNMAGTILKPGCELSPAIFTAYRYIAEFSMSKVGSLGQIVRSLYMRALFATLKHKEKTAKTPEELLHLAKTKVLRKKKLVYSDLAFFFNRKDGPLFFDKLKMKEKTEKILEFLSGIYGDPIKWLKENIPKPKQLISKSKSEDIASFYNKQIPYLRIYLPSNVSVRENRVVFFHGADALEHFLTPFK
jgi:hypothetical protein